MTITAQNRRTVRRRTGLALGLVALGTGVLATRKAEAGTSGKGMMKVTVLYGDPKDQAAFEKYYADHHMPMIYAVEGVARVELSRPMPGPDNKAPPYYRITEIWFKDPATMKEVRSRPEWKKISEDVPNFATGGATILVSQLE
jgi:uncharacterized protein (TIGR02118 family)